MRFQCFRQAARDYDEGVPFAARRGRELEENFWRAIRFGLDGKLIDFQTKSEYPAAAALDRLLEWTSPVRAELGIEPALEPRNSTQELRARHQAGEGLHELFADVVESTRSSYGLSGAPNG